MVGKGGIGNDADIDAEFRQGLAGKVALIAFDKIGEDLVGIDDVAVAVAMNDEIAKRVDQAAKALLALLHFPHAIGQRLDLGAAAGGGLVKQGRGTVFAAPGAQMQGKAGEADCQQCDADEDRRPGQMRQAGQHDDGDKGQEGQAFAPGEFRLGHQRRRGDKAPRRAGGVAASTSSPVSACWLSDSAIMRNPCQTEIMENCGGSFEF